MKKNNTQMNKFSATASIRLSLDEGTELLKRADTLGKGVRMAVESFINNPQPQSTSEVQGNQINWENSCFDIDVFLAEEGLSSSEGIGKKIALWYWKSVFGVVVQGTTTDEINKKIDELELLEF